MRSKDRCHEPDSRGGGERGFKSGQKTVAQPEDRSYDDEGESEEDGAAFSERKCNQKYGEATLKVVQVRNTA